MSAADRLLEKLPNHRRNGNGWQAPCPAHDDRDPSLSITPADGKVLVKCHAGCSTADIVAAVGLTVGDLFDEPAKPSQRQVVARYPYRDEAGDVLFEVVRYAPKDFRQRRPDGRGGWVWKLGDTRMVLYRLPELLADRDATVFVVEGEKDADALAADGYLATCGPQGAGKWSKVSVLARQVLAGRDVVVVADRDQPGYAHARDVVASLTDVAADITVVEAVNGKDVADHLGAGHTVAELLEVELDAAAGGKKLSPDAAAGVTKVTPASTTDDDTAADRLGWEVVDLTAAWNGEKVEPPAVVLRRSDGVHLLPAGISYLFGDSGDGKSWVALIATVQKLRNGEHVVWVTYEDPNELEVVKRLKVLGATGDDIAHLSLITPPEPLTTGVAWLARLVRSTGAALLVVDSTGEANAVEGVNEDSDHEWGQWARSTLRRVIDLAADPDWEGADGTPVNDWVAELPIDHSTKARDGSLFPSGTKRKRAMVTGRMFMMNVRQAFAVGKVGRVQLVVAKDRTGVFRPREVAAEITMDATAVPYVIDIDPPPEGSEMSTGKKRPALERVLAVLVDTEQALTASEVHRIVNGDEHQLPGEAAMALSTVKNTLTKLDKRPGVHKVIEKNDDRGGVTHRYQAVEGGPEIASRIASRPDSESPATEDAA